MIARAGAIFLVARGAGRIVGRFRAKPTPDLVRTPPARDLDPFVLGNFLARA